MRYSFCISTTSSGEIRLAPILFALADRLVRNFQALVRVIHAIFPYLVDVVLKVPFCSLTAARFGNDTIHFIELLRVVPRYGNGFLICV
jgi:hypothetical protein